MRCYPLVFRFYCVGSYMYTVGLDVDTSLFYSSHYDIAVPTELKSLVVSYFIWFLFKIENTFIIYLRIFNFIHIRWT